jgi:hypothetical protein
MEPWRARRLTPGEVALAAETFGPSLDASRVRIWSAPVSRRRGLRPFVPGGWVWPGRTLVVYPRDLARTDFTAAEVSLWDQSVLIHELTHAWQSQRGVNLLLSKLRAGDGPAAYAYRLTPDCRWDGFNIEQQAMIVQHDFLRRRGRAAPHPETAYLAVLPFGRPNA